MKSLSSRACWARWGRGDEGSVAIEAAVILPPLIMFICLAIAGGRLVTSGAKIDAAAEDAAREASIHRTVAAAQNAAQAAAAESLGDQGITCASADVTVNTGGLSVPVGQVGTVTVTVTCTVTLSDLLLPGVPGARTLTSTATSVVDQYRQRALGFTDPALPSLWNSGAEVGGEDV
ncbi:TadE/TadG family type IV pilus assembly protein [Streptomyces sp. V4I2]|uniref:TadE/TadG family type IV pilus assembly protein n=1 Tax=Streptomyces sp. V4I2 TaxID=3042280 RepID=UPI002782CC87|nr:TadE family protein [Streptomyces sp. V4I2]MDQ1041871.1 Flp pilus assembly protein TadG [Streptomyces sp. V4I2]